MRLNQKLCWYVAVAILHWMLKTFCSRLAPHVYHIAKNVSLYLVRAYDFTITEVWRLTYWILVSASGHIVVKPTNDLVITSIFLTFNTPNTIIFLGENRCPSFQHKNPSPQLLALIKTGKYSNCLLSQILAQYLDLHLLHNTSGKLFHI